MYNHTIEEISASRKHIHFSISKDAVGKAIQEAYTDLQKNVRLPGFRKGHVPQKVLQQRFAMSVYSDVSNKLVQDAYSTVDHKALNIVSSPSIEGELVFAKPNADFEFVIGVDVRPDVAVNNYKGIEVHYPTIVATEEDVNSRIDMMMRSKRKIQAVEDQDAVVSDGDHALVSLKLTADGAVAVDEPGTMIAIGSNKFYTGLDEHLKGMKTGEDKECEVTITEESKFEHLRGKTFQANISLSQIQRMQAPELTDELAVDFGYTDVANMKDSLQTEIANRKDENFKNSARIEILQQLVNAHDFSVPKSMVDEQLQALMNELRMQRMYAGEKANNIKFSPAQMQDLTQRATFAAKAACLMASICKVESLAVTDEDVENKLQELAASQGQTIETIKAYIQMEGADDVLRDRVQEEKTLNWLLEQAVRLEEPKKVADASAE